VNVPAHEVHVRLKDPGDLTRLVRFDQHETRAASGEVVPASELVGLVCARIVLLDDSLAHRLRAHPGCHTNRQYQSISLTS